jgi:hypothetical protein
MTSLQVTPDKVSLVVARVQCTRLIASAHLQAARGDVNAACASWVRDHLSWANRVAFERIPSSMEASE